MVYKNIIIGGGASGLMFASNLKDKKSSVIVENSPNLGAKILISGGGRCNFTNKVVDVEKYLADSKFLKPLLREYSSKKIYNYFSKKGIESTIKNGSEYFCKNSSKDILNLLINDARGVETLLNTKVLRVKKSSNIFEVTTNRGVIFGKNLIVASGGLSFAKLGATSIGLDIAKSFGHKIVKTNPALVGLTLQSNESFFKSLSGVSLGVEIKVEKRRILGSLLFAHKGISGPAVLNASLFWQKGEIEIDFLPNFKLENIRGSKKSISNLLPLPKRVAKAFLEKFKIEDKKATLLSKKEFEELKRLKCYKFAPAGTFGYNKAEVTKGGVSIEQIDNKTFESKLESNLYFLGEVLDVTGMLGGYNFHFSFSSALSCAKYINKE